VFDKPRKTIQDIFFLETSFQKANLGIIYKNKLNYIKKKLAVKHKYMNLKFVFLRTSIMYNNYYRTGVAVALVEVVRSLRFLRANGDMDCVTPSGKVFS
jgi:hypothetical protein